MSKLICVIKKNIRKWKISKKRPCVHLGQNANKMASSFIVVEIEWGNPMSRKFQLYLLNLPCCMEIWNDFNKIVFLRWKNNLYDLQEYFAKISYEQQLRSPPMHKCVLLTGILHYLYREMIRKLVPLNHKRRIMSNIKLKY